MAFPIAGAAAGLSLVGMFMGAYGQQKSAAINRKLTEYNVGVAEFQAEDAVRRGAVASRMRRQQTKQTIGSQRVSLARQGIDINDGSAVDVQENTAYLGELDAMTIKNNAAREAWGFKVDAANMRIRGEQMTSEANWNTAQTLLTGASNLLLASKGFGRSSLSADPLLVR